MLDIDAELDAFGVTFAPVVAAPVSFAEAAWMPGRGLPGSEKGGPERKLELADVIDESIAKGAWGDAAEQALLHWVALETAPLLAIPEGREALLGVFAPRSRTRRQVEEHLAREDIPRALHIAEMWSGAGYDILGLERTGTGVQPVRYECKGLPRSARVVRVFLSRRELAVARAVHRDGPGIWKLIGVETSGRTVDLTPFIEELLDEQGALLAPLHDRGLEEDGLRLVVERDSTSDEE